MTDSRNVEERISVWFDQQETVSRFPDPLLRATFEHTRGLRQARSSNWRTFPMFRNFAALAATGAAAVTLAVIGVALVQFVPGQTGGAPSPSPTPSQTTATGQMWPQSSLGEVRQAQAAADAGDPDYAWQLDPEIANGNSPTAEIVDRFIHEVIGWEEYVFNPFVGWDAAESNLNYLKCAPGEVNPIYPQDEFRGHCAPTIDEFTYETLIVDLAQPVRSDPSGIWVVLRWTMGPPFAQVDPAVAEAGATARLEEFLQARIAGQGAEGHVDVGGQRGGTLDEVPLLYSASSGAPYERYEIDAVGGPQWPYGDMEFDVRLFADGGETVVEQPFRWRDSRLHHDVTETKENGQPVGLAFAFFDGQVLLTAARPWVGGFERDSLDLGDRYYGGPGPEEAIVLVRDPVPGCASGRAAADSDALASSLESDPTLQATAPVTVNLGGVDAVTMDVTLAPGASGCTVLKLADGSERRGANLVRGSQMRLYLFDMPEGSSMRILAIAIVAPEARFDAVTEAATPVMDSIEFPARGGDQ